ncbi:hypothetical protein FBU59_000700 [Linderina macrospora]|uniref:Uncharacterized protein n=1 Tax=Linderina macrospora TaxID=4868 RepID=A0ACC1JG56_9FUNG|nr:hypothetical protein FBU59_000700 [Linderina macrospora]
MQIPRTIGAHPENRFRPYPPEVVRGGSIVDIRMKRRGPKPKKSKLSHALPDKNTAEKKMPSAADISNLLVNDHRVVLVDRPSTRLGSASSPESNCQEYVGLPETPNAHASMLSFEAASAGDLLDQFYSDKVCTETREAIITFFDIHYAKLPIFHPSTFIRSVVDHTVNPLLIDAIKALSSHNMSGCNINTEKLVASLKSRVLLCMDEQPSLEAVQAMVIMTLLEIFRERHYSLAVLLHATIGLIIQLKWHEIDLYKTKTPETWAEWVEMETKRRVFWAVFQFDNLVSITQGGHSTIIPESIIFVRAPCMDTEWNDVDFASYTPESQIQQPMKTAKDAEHMDAETSIIPSEPATEIRVVVNGAMSHSYAKIIELGSNNCRIVRFLWDAKAGMHDVDKYALSERPFPAANFLEKLPSKGILAYPICRKARLISEYPEFQKYSDRLRRLYKQIQPPERSTDKRSGEGCFRSAMCSQFPVRIRYLMLQCFVCAVLILLHSSNRLSFFTEFDDPPEMHPDDMNPDELRRISLFKTRFGATWSQSLLAKDIEPESWKICVKYAHKLARFIEHNSDLPYDRITYASAQCMFIVLSVLLRQINMCTAALAAGDDSQMSLREWQEERDRCVEETQVVWKKLKEFNTIWTITDMTELMKSLDIDNATTTTEELLCMC